MACAMTNCAPNCEP